ncbi:hypothetical protein [Phormidesmis sp. 146-33]
MNGLNRVRLSMNQMKALIAASTLTVTMGYAQLAQAKPLTGATTPAPEFVRGGGGCGQFGRVDPGQTTPAGREVANRVLLELIMRRCVMEGVPVTTAEEDRIYPLIKALTAGIRDNLGNGAGTKAQYDTFLAGVRRILDANRIGRIEAHVAALLASNTARPSNGTQMITESQPAGGTQLLQPEFQRGRGCSVFGTANAGKVSRNIQQAVSRVVLQSVFRRCLLENVPLTDAEDARLFPALNALAQGAGPRQYERFVTVARQTLDPARAARVEANVAQARRGL